MRYLIQILTLITILFTVNIYLAGENYTREIIGYSVNNRPIEIYKFNKGNDLLIIIAGIHGNESNTSKTVYQIIDLLNEKKIKIPLKKSIWIVPQANPDGIIRDRRINDNNVDINRNFDTYDWKPFFYFFNVLISSGSHPFSEPEAKALKKLFEGINKNNLNTIVLSLHSRGDMIIPGNNSAGNLKLAKIINQNSSYNINQIGYNTTGDLTKWLSNKIGIPSVTIEFKSKIKTETDEIVKIINSLLKIDFYDAICKHDVKPRIQDYSNIYNLDFFFNDLPENIKNNIVLSEESKRSFIKIYNKLDNDNELLMLVNKKYHLSAEYIPDDLVDVSGLFPTTKKSVFIRKIILNDLSEMFEAARNNGINLSIISAYRSYESQKSVYKHWKDTLGEEEAKRVSAYPGASQHQLGTTIDFNSLNFSFGESREGKWLVEESYKYGFIMSYPKGMEEITGYKYEPWHFRYIGKDAAFLVHHYFNNMLEIFLNWYWNKHENR